MLSELAARIERPDLFALADDLTEAALAGRTPHMNAAADRLEDAFPHGTREGWKQGCRGNACPAADEYGLSCKRANQLAAGDYGYQKLVKRGLGPAEIALELGLIPEAPTTPVVTKRPAAARAATPKPAPTKPDPVPAPETTTVEAAPAGEVPTAAPRRSTSAPSQATVRAWARENGIDVNAKGSIRADVLAAYLDAHPADVDDEAAAAAIAPAPPAAQGEASTPTTPEAPAPPTVTADDLDTWAEDHPTHGPGITDQIDELRPRIDMPARPAPEPIDDTALDGATTTPPPNAAVTTPGEFAARWNGLTHEERTALVTSMRVARDQAERCHTDNHADLVALRDTRPDWATVATAQDLAHAIAQRDQARRFAEDSLAEVAHVEERVAAGIAFALEQWGTAAAERDHLRQRVTALSNELAAVRDVEQELHRAYEEIDRLRLVHAGQARLATMAVFMADVDGTGQEIAAFRAEYDRQHTAKVLRGAAGRVPRSVAGRRQLAISAWLRAEADRLTDHTNGSDR